MARAGRAAFVVDDLVSTDPWTPRMLTVRGRAETLAGGGQGIMPMFDPALIRVFPERTVSFGINAAGIAADARSVPGDASA